ncbi:hypothetical protein [Aurantiacibacter spongiae]|uniref:Uncharacterized protein n=1 Tax=Aurantiacibacter spongiae TaxID=2488860 RepID=A0A3N5DLF1_9SPHN|nr:hypothetical protein [Aurantiacibacter spongiae]RPF71615.1 hypothetical protein EG799_08265 [Aurantiacibacter spongiae]
MTEHQSATSSGSPILPRLLCRLGQHRPRGRRADWDGEQFVSRCEFCDRAIRRVRKKRWARMRK